MTSANRPVLAGIVAVSCAMGAAHGQEAYELPYNASARGTDGFPLYVEDAEIARRIPQFAALGMRVGTCMAGMVVPPALTIAFAPTMTAPHEGLSNILECQETGDRTSLSCHAHLRERPVVYDADPAQYFELGADTDRDDALAVFRAFRDGAIAFADGVKPHFPSLPITRISREGDHFVITRSDCGCSERIEVRRDPSSPSSFIGAAIAAICA